MTDFAKVFNIYSTESDQDGENENFNVEQIKRVNASVNQDYSKSYVRITIKIPQMKTKLNWCKFTRASKNGLITKATYHGTRVFFEFMLNQGKPTEAIYEYSSREPFRGPIEYNKSYIKYKDEYVIWFIHKSEPW
ncbi:unnamed protein product [Rotaria sp. Silwood2]|nr:unnamed protein product [Rotaria sp. Silwood2]CAF2520291.1 unnamed protein product [Rotaria sp. Silwood2]CAF2776528.1 unnamed protein product [Rotaria sp. Silwood2]CAF2920234.1 unnamed protein product [Rotaria sp. Silwood2]CAF4024850.1 unnamed protein product [Rotaria sp. Silwood2]